MPKLLIILLFFTSCSSIKKITQSPTLQNAHTGILIVQQKKSGFKTIASHQSNKYFIPASNTKIVTLYAAMKHLGDSLIAARYFLNDTALFLQGTGDPSFLQPEFHHHPLMDFIRKINKPVYIDDQHWRSDAFGTAWSWDDYSEYYMPERSAFPVFGNVIRWKQERSGEAEQDSTEFDQSVFIYSTPEVNWDVRFNPAPDARAFSVQRDQHRNAFTITQGKEKEALAEVPFITDGVNTAIELLQDSMRIAKAGVKEYPGIIHSQPLDTVLKKMMQRSDNFYAEQLVMQVSDTLFHLLNDTHTRDSLLNSIYKELPQKPRWADGSGLSRFNLFSPEDFVEILKSLEQFPEQRLFNLFNVYELPNGKAYAKTGTLTGVVALSGYFISSKGNRFIFSFLVNNHKSTASEVRNEFTKILRTLR